MAYVDLIYKLADTDIDIDIIGEVTYLSEEYLISQDDNNEYKAYILDENDELYLVEDEDMRQEIIDKWREEAGIKDSWGSDCSEDMTCDDFDHLASEDSLNLISENFDEEIY